MYLDVIEDQDNHISIKEMLGQMYFKISNDSTSTWTSMVLIFLRHTLVCHLEWWKQQYPRVLWQKY